MFADDVKLFVAIEDERDCAGVQKDLDALWTWCETNHLALNLRKYKVLTLTRKRDSIRWDYSLGGHRLERVEKMMDLGVLVDSKQISFLCASY